MRFDDKKMAVTGLGYVGLPLAGEFGNIRSVTGFDINQKRTTQLSQGIDNIRQLGKPDAILYDVKAMCER